MTSVCLAQKTPVEKYELVPDAHMQIFFDYVAPFSGRSISTTNGSYIGQMNREKIPCGYGMHIGTDGSNITGMFYQGRLLFGITQTPTNTIVGSPDHYIVYSNTTGRVEHLVWKQEQIIMKGQEQYDYGFVTMRYANGDQYTGEIYQNRRHGFGIYYYANGDIWYGPYDNDQRNGYGVLFTESVGLLPNEGFTKSEGIILGEWRGEQVVKAIPIKLR